MSCKVTRDDDRAGLANCQTVASIGTMKAGSRKERNPIMTTDQDNRQDEVTSRLTPTQLRIRERCGKVPKHIQRSVDRYRIALGRPPLWGGFPERQRRQ
jgi:hypothetical protein